MSLVDIPSPDAEDQIMDPATKQYIDFNAAIAEARSDAKLAELRSIVESYTARAEEREQAARDREQAARDREQAAREREQAMKEREELRASAAEARHRDVERQIEEFRKDSKTTRRTVVITGITTALAIAAINHALVQNMFAAVEAGRQASPAQVEILMRLNNIEKQLAGQRAARDH